MRVPKIRCYVPNCGNSAKQGPDRRDILFFSVPRNRILQWLEAIGRPDLTLRKAYPNNCRVCSEHFREKDFEPDAANKLLNLTTRKKLRPDAVPSLKLPTPEEMLKMKSKKVLIKEKKSKKQSVPYHQEICLICSEIIPATNTYTCSSYKFPGSLDSDLLNEQLWSTYILHKIVELPGCKFEDILKTANPNPSKWFVLCDTCSRTVINMLELQDKIRGYQRKAETFMESLKLKLRSSLEVELAQHDANEQINITQTIRQYSKWPDHKVKIEMSSEDAVGCKSDAEEEMEIHSEPEETNLENDNDVDENWAEDEPLQELKKGKFERGVDPSTNKKQRKKARRKTAVKTSRSEDDDSVEKEKPTCSLCNFVCKNNSGLASHIRRKHKNKTPPIVCEICGFLTDLKQVMRAHIFHHKIFDNSSDPSISTTEFICNLCKQLFKTRQELTRHKLSTHAEELELTVHTCSYCPRVFSQKQSLVFHELKIHEKRGLYPCDKCSYEAVSKTALNLHAASKHSETPRYFCQYCSVTYMTKGAFHNHMLRYHTDKFVPKWKIRFGGVAVDRLSMETNNIVPMSIQKQQMRTKEVKCKYCDAIFPYKLALTIHQQEAHKDLYKHSCNQCDKVYMSTASLQLHKKISHLEKDKRVKCAWCSIPISHRLYMYSHVKVCPKRPKVATNAQKILAVDDYESDQNTPEEIMAVDDRETDKNENG